VSARHTPLSNGAVVSTWGVYQRPCSVRHTLIVVGQHGDERGPILGAAAWSPAVGSAVTLVRLANPYGFAVDRRGYLAGDEIRDMNRDWGSDGTVADEIWQTVLEHVGRVPDRVIDLHSAPTHRPGSRALGMLVLTPSERTRELVADPLAARLATVEPG
jgi:predicted deacylase